MAETAAAATTPTSSQATTPIKTPRSDRDSLPRQSSSGPPVHGAAHQGTASRGRQRPLRLPQSLFGLSDDAHARTDEDDNAGSLSARSEDSRARSRGPPSEATASSSSSLPTSSSLLHQASLWVPESRVGASGPMSSQTRAPTNQSKAAAVSSSSLFGAVMTSFHKQSGSRSATTAVGSCSTPLPSTLGPWSTQTQEALSSPAAPNLLDVVNALSPFQFTSPNSRTGTETSPATDSSLGPTEPHGSWEIPLQPIPHDCPEKDADSILITMDQFPEDWSVKGTLRTRLAAAHPTTVLASLARSNARGEWTARRQFVGGTRLRSREQADAALQWHRARLYWEYRPRYRRPRQEPRTVTRGTYQTRLSQLGKRTRSGRTENFQKTDDHDRAMPPPFQVATASSTDENADREHCQEWRDALLSLYRAWLQSLLDMSQGITHTTCYRDCYFYALGHDHTALFRASLSGELSHATETDTGQSLLPTVVLSSSSRVFREKLRQRGVTIYYVRPFQDSTVCQERDLIAPLQNGGSTCHQGDAVESRNQGTDAAPMFSPTKAELIALRQSQVRGNMVGPHVKVAMNHRTTPGGNDRKRRSQRWAQSVPALEIRGFDDCAAFLEVYWNMYGQVHYCDAQSPEGKTQAISESSYYDCDLAARKLPTLLCREVGPFAFATLQTLEVCMDKSPAVATHEGIAASRHRHASQCEIRGPILPCALRRLVVACVEHVRRKAVENGWSTDNSTDSLSASSPSGLGAKEAMNVGGDVDLQLSTEVHQTDDEHGTDGGAKISSSAIMKSIRIGVANSRSMNSHNSTLSMMTWRNGRPNVLGCLSEHWEVD